MANREIKFRIWNGSQMENRIMAGYLGAFYVQGIDEKDAACMSPFNTKYQNETPLMQYTGIKDKVGVDIYEGDVVKCSYGIGQVVFMSGYFGVVWIDDVEANSELLCSKDFRKLRNEDESFKVIGNIYEKNPNDFLNTGA